MVGTSELVVFSATQRLSFRSIDCIFNADSDASGLMPQSVGQCDGRGAEGVKASWAVDSLLAVTPSCYFIYIHLELIRSSRSRCSGYHREFVSSRSSLCMALALTQFVSDGSLYRDSRRSRPSDEVQGPSEFQWFFSANAPHALSFYKRLYHAVSITILEAHGLNRCIG